MCLTNISTPPCFRAEKRNRTSESSRSNTTFCPLELGVLPTKLFPQIHEAFSHLTGFEPAIRAFQNANAIPCDTLSLQGQYSLQDYSVHVLAIPTHLFTHLPFFTAFSQNTLSCPSHDLVFKAFAFDIFWNTHSTP